MNPSESHLRVNRTLQQMYFSSLDIVENPEILGPNWQTVLHFWKYVDSLTEKQFKKVSHRYGRGDVSTTHFIKVDRGFKKIVNSQEVYQSIWRKVGPASALFLNSGPAASRATYELVCVHDLLEQNQKLQFIRLFDDL